MESVINGKNIARNEEGYLTDFSQWDETVAETIAKEEGIALTEQHWDVGAAAHLLATEAITLSLPLLHFRILNNFCVLYWKLPAPSSHH